WWHTLALAHYRAGDWKASVATMAKAMALRGGHGGAQDWWEWRFVLAMAHWQLGDKKQARQWYDQGLQSLEENERSMDGQQHKEIHSYRDEAAALLSIKDGMLALQLKKYAEAEPLRRESLAMGEQKLPDDWRTFNTQSML